MALKKPTPKTFTTEEAKAITQGFAEQSGVAKRATSYDPKNYPVFEVPVNQKLLVYIPNHTVTTADGGTDLRMDKFFAHPIIDGRTYANVRCINGQVSDNPQLNWDGTCPICDGMAECWELYKHEYADIAKSRGIAPDAPEADELLKNDRINLLRDMRIKNSERWYTFPIVVIDCEEKDGVKTTQPRLDAQGRVQGTPMWYSIRERTFLDKWVAGYDSIDGETPTSPAGLWAVLNFTYAPKSGNPDKMGSAKALKVTFKSMDGYQEWAKYFDQLTEEWTPAKAQEVVVLDVLRSMEETKEVADSVLKPVRDKLALYALSGGAVPAQPAQTLSGNAEAALAGFGATPAAPSAPAVPSAPAAPSGMPFGGEMPSNSGLE